MKPRKPISIVTRDESPFHLGAKVYVVETKKYWGHVAFKERCPVCDDEKRVNIRGYDFDCPMCRGNRFDESATTIRLREYAVIEYIINECTITGPTYKNAYTASGLLEYRNLPTVIWEGFARWGVGYSDMKKMTFSAGSLREVDPKKIDIRFDCSGHCFLSKSDAVKFYKLLNEEQKKALDNFNAEHGTNHQYPFEF